jgi:hypothetical protein
MSGIGIGDIAGWVAPAATAVAALMTAANLGARVTGWGFVVFTIGSIGWSIVGVTSGQHNLLATNAFLTLVNMLGIWRWLGRQARYEDSGQAAVEASEQEPAVPTLAAASRLIGQPAHFANGSQAGTVVEMMVECPGARMAYIVVAVGGVGGIGEKLCAIDRNRITLCGDHIELSIDRAMLDTLPDWKAEARETKDRAPPRR